MSDSPTTELTQAVTAEINCPEMSLWEKVSFLGVPLAWTIMLLPMALFFLLLLMLRLWSSLPPHGANSSAKEIFAEIAIFVIFGAGSYLSTSILVRSVRRKRKVGSFFPIREELAAYRTRRKKWSNMVFLLVFAGFSLSGTFSLLKSQQVHHPSNWLFIALLWIATLLVALDSIFGSERIWLDTALAVTFLSIGAWSVIRMLATHSPALGHWIFPILMVAFAFAAGYDAYRLARQKLRSPAG